METTTKIVLTEDEVKLYKRAVNQTYQYIADDACFTDRTPLSEILEVVLDADRVHSFGKLTKEQYAKFEAWLDQEIKECQDKKMTWKATYKHLAKTIW